MQSLTALARSVSASWSDEQLVGLASAFRDHWDGEVEPVALLADSLANSGVVEVFAHAADVASTGGPSSLTTLICPLYLVSAGWNVPKVTVPGRPAGGIDVLATIPGYQTNPSVEQMRQWLNAAHYVHAEAASQWAPLDGRLFRLRQMHGMQSVAPLVVASILSKKRALRLQNAVVEIRRGRFGNLGNDDSRLRQVKSLFESAGSRIDIRCTAEITGNGAPYQPMIGRGEALVALYAIFEDCASQALNVHLALCRALSERAANHPISASCKDLKEAFSANLSAQGTSYEAFRTRVETVLSQQRTAIKARATGVLAWDLGALRNAIVNAQHSEGNLDAAGVELLVLQGPVERGQEIAIVRGSQDVRKAVETTYTFI